MARRTRVVRLPTQAVVDACGNRHLSSSLLACEVPNGVIQVIVKSNVLYVRTRFFFRFFFRVYVYTMGSYMLPVFFGRKR